MALLVRMMVPVFSITYTLFSSHPELPHQVHWQGNHWQCPIHCSCCEGSTCYCSCKWHDCVFGSTCQWYHWHTIATWWQLWCMQSMSDIWSAIIDWCLHRFQGVQQDCAFSHLFNWEVGQHCWFWCHCFGECDVRSGSLQVGWIACCKFH